MKKNVMALSIAAMIGGLGFAGAASAGVIPGTGAAVDAATIAAAAGKMAARTATGLAVSEGGVGHALVVPYYNAQNGNMTVLHVTNTDQTNGKLVKVRFRSASNSDDVLDFQVFMSPGDVWTAAVMAGADGVANIVTADNTCTVPTLTKNVAQPFVQTRLPSYADAATKANLTREGYVEIFNMADITNVTAWTADGTPSTTGTVRSPLFTATKHVGGVAPCSVAGSAARTLVDTVATTSFTAEDVAAKRGLQTPTSGLMGDWYIINVPQTTTFAGAATAIQLTGAANARGNFVHFPQLDTAAVAAAVDANTLTADPLFRTTQVVTNANVAPTTVPALALLNFDLPDMSTPFYADPAAAAPLAQAQALQTALRVNSVTNQYANDASISAKTDWTFSMPTRRYNVAANYSAGTTLALATASAQYRLFSDLGAANHADDMFYPGGTSGGPLGAGNTTIDTAGNICVIADGQRFFDREETTGSTVPVFSPGTGTTVQFCGEVSVLAFRDTGTSVLGASVARRTLTTGSYENGWGVLDTANGGKGLPILGASFIKLENPSASAGKSGTYGITWPHRFTR